MCTTTGKLMAGKIITETKMLFYSMPKVLMKVQDKKIKSCSKKQQYFALRKGCVLNLQVLK